MGNIEELEKIAYQLTTELPVDEPMNPQPEPPSQEEVDALQAENQLLEEAIAQAEQEEQLTPEEVEEAILAEQGGEPVEEELTEDELLNAALAQVDERELEEALTSKVASELIGLGTIAKLVECAYGDCGEEWQKTASSIIEEMTSSEEAFTETLEKTANSLFSNEENRDDLFSPVGVAMVFEQLARFENDEFEKVANDDGGLLNNLRSMAGNAIEQTKRKVSDAVDSVVNFKNIKAELDQATQEIEPLQRVLADDLKSGVHDPMVREQYDNLAARIGQLDARHRLGKGVLGGAGALALGGAALGGYKLNQHLNQGEEQVASEMYGSLEKEANAEELARLKQNIQDRKGEYRQVVRDNMFKNFGSEFGAGMLGGLAGSVVDAGIDRKLGIKQPLGTGVGSIVGSIGGMQLGKQTEKGKEKTKAIKDSWAKVKDAKKEYKNAKQEKTALLLPQQKLSGTLETGMYKNDGGIEKMSQQLVKDFLKLAGAAGLVGIVQNENLDFGLRKEASETLDYIATLGRSRMDDELVKVAQQIFPENELHEIVANQHTPQLVEKVAYFLEANETSIDELEKVANAGGVAAVKNLGAGLADSVSNIEATIDTEKAKTEGAGREYIGDVQHGGGKAGGALTGDLAGYNVINNPEKYDIEQTASILEEAFLAKQAAEDAYYKADAFIQSILNK